MKLKGGLGEVKAQSVLNRAPRKCRRDDRSDSPSGQIELRTASLSHLKELIG